MADVFGYIMVSLLILALAYSLARQIRYTLAYQKLDETSAPNYRRSLFGHYLLSVSLAGFLVSFILNAAAGLQLVNFILFTSDNTAFSCFLFLGILLLANFWVIPKNQKHLKLLNKKWN